MIIDTDLLIDYFRGYKCAMNQIRNVIGPAISIITLFELFQGARNRGELTKIRRMLNDWDFNIIAFDEEQSYRALFLMEKYTLTNGLKMADAMIAACVLNNKQELLTGNYNDFNFIAGLSVLRYNREPI